MSTINRILTLIRNHVSGLIFAIVFLILIFSFKEKMAIYFNPESTYETIKPVDRSLERDRLTCYKNRIPKEVIDFCDSQIEEKQ